MIKHLKLLILLVVLVFPFVQNWTALEILKLKTDDILSTQEKDNREFQIARTKERLLDRQTKQAKNTLDLAETIDDIPILRQNNQLENSQLKSDISQLAKEIFYLKINKKLPFDIPKCVFENQCKTTHYQGITYYGDYIPQILVRIPKSSWNIHQSLPSFFTLIINQGKRVPVKLRLLNNKEQVHQWIGPMNINFWNTLTQIVYVVVPLNPDTIIETQLGDTIVLEKNLINIDRILLK